MFCSPTALTAIGVVHVAGKWRVLGGVIFTFFLSQAGFDDATLSQMGFDDVSQTKVLDWQADEVYCTQFYAARYLRDGVFVVFVGAWYISNSMNGLNKRLETLLGFCTQHKFFYKYQ